MKEICAIAFWVGCSAAFAQGTFSDLDFESGNPGLVAFAFSVPVASALSGWSLPTGAPSFLTSDTT